MTERKYYWNDPDKLPSLLRRIRKGMLGKGILYEDFKGIFGDPTDDKTDIKRYIVETAIEAGFLQDPQKQLSSIFDIENYEITLDEDHPYFEAVKHEIGYPVTWIQLKVSDLSAKLTFCGGKLSNKGTVLNYIDGIHNFLESLCCIDYQGWNPEDDQLEEGTLVEYYEKEFYNSTLK